MTFIPDDPGLKAPRRLPLRLRIINRLIRWTGRQYHEVYFSRFFPTPEGLVRRPYPTGQYRLATRAEFGLPDDASNSERIIRMVSGRAGRKGGEA